MTQCIFHNYFDFFLRSESIQELMNNVETLRKKLSSPDMLMRDNKCTLKRFQNLLHDRAGGFNISIFSKLFQLILVVQTRRHGADRQKVKMFQSCCGPQG